MAALRLGDRADLHRWDVCELRLQAAAHGVPYLDAAVAGGEGEEIGGGAEGCEEVPNGGRGGRHGPRSQMVVAAAAGGKEEKGFMRRRGGRGFWGSSRSSEWSDGGSSLEYMDTPRSVSFSSSPESRLSRTERG